MQDTVAWVEAVYCRDTADRATTLARRVLRGDPAVEAAVLSAQDKIFLVGMRRPEDRESLLGPWFPRTVTWVALTVHRKRLRESQIDPEDLEPLEASASTARSPAEEAETVEASSRLLQAIDTLTLGQRHVMTLILEGYESAAVAEALGISEGNVRQRTFRAMGRLRTILNRIFGEVSPRGDAG